MRRWALTILVGMLFAIPDGADATSPGKNGKLVFTRSFGILYTVNADGSGLAEVPNAGQAGHPNWSPNGLKIAYDGGSSQIFTINPDGTDKQVLSPDLFIHDTDPYWSPDGTQIAFTRGGGDIFKMNADGTNKTRVTLTDTAESQSAWSPDGLWIALAGTNTGTGDPTDIKKMDPNGNTITNLTNRPGRDYDPSWAPDNSKIAFIQETVVSGVTSRQIFTLNADGSNLTQLTTDATQKGQPVWSPDGTKIAFTTSNTQLWVMNADGTGAHAIPGTPTDSRDPDWQSIPIEGYPRPKGAEPFTTHFTVAYKPCTAPNEQHGAPLDVGSCSPPQQSSDYLTVGTLDANGEAANASGFLRADPKPDKPSTSIDDADVWLWTAVEDVRNKTDLSDYTGELLVTVTRRITDKFNTPSPQGGATGAATTQDVALPITVPCAATADTTVGSTCELQTSAEVLYPGEVPGNGRSNWELRQVQVYDGGADQDADTTADNTLFMGEGVFVP